MQQKDGILQNIGLQNIKSIDNRLLQAPEWNLLANREGWGKTKIQEWTNTVSRPGPMMEWVDFETRLAIGDSTHGGAGRVESIPTFAEEQFVGFRTAIVLGA